MGVALCVDVAGVGSKMGAVRSRTEEGQFLGGEKD